MISPLQIWLIILVALVLLLLIIIFLIRINHKQQLIYQYEQIQQIREQIIEFIPPKLKALDDWKIEVHTAIKLSGNDRPKRRGPERDQYDLHIINKILHCDQNEQFFELTDTHLDGFATFMRKEFQISDRELMFVCLSLLSMSDEQIALIMGYSYASIPTTRKRIANKLGINNSANWQIRLLEFVNRE